MKTTLAIIALLLLASAAQAQTPTVAGLTYTQIVSGINANTSTALTVPAGGTGAATLASNGILYGNGTSAVLALAVNSSGTNKFLTQSSSGAPAWNTLVAGDIPSLNTSILTAGTLPEARGGTNQSTYTTGDILYASGTNTLSKLGIGSTGNILSVSGGVPSWGALPAATTTAITADQTASVNNAYVNNKSGSQLVLTLPAAATVGQFVTIIGGTNASGWKIAQGASQKVHVGSTTSTTGVSGYVSSNEEWDVVTIVCTVANTDFVITYSSGSLTVN